MPYPDDVYAEALRRLKQIETVKQEMRTYMRFLCNSLHNALFLHERDINHTLEVINEALEDLFFEEIRYAQDIQKDWERAERRRALSEWKNI